MENFQTKIFEDNINFMSRKIKYIIFLFLFFIIYQQLWRTIGRDTYVDNLIKIFPNSASEFVKKTFFLNKLQKIELENLKNENKKLREEITKLDRKNFENKIKFADPMEINLTNEFEFEIFNEEFEIKKYLSPYNIPKILGKGTAYLGFDEKNIFIVGGSGLISYINKDQLLKNNLKKNFIQPIPTNLSKKITDNRFFNKSIYGIKGTHIFQNKIYISYTNELKEDCYTTSILAADLNTSYLNFTDFFINEECVGFENEYGKFNAAQSGGKILTYDDKNLIVSIGEYRYRDHAQDISNIFGKIIKINIDTKKYDILSMGHRNVHGMYYDIKNKKIISVEHGPDGGDEINFNYLGDGKIKNFGWPISSYGEHYGGKDDIGNKIWYEKAPFYKSHEKHGFIEPAYYFLPSLGASSVSKIPNFYFDDQNKDHKYLIVGTLGWKNKKGEKSLHFFKFKNNKLLDKHYFNLNDRVRDIVYDKERNLFYIWTDTTSSLLILKKK